MKVGDSAEISRIFSAEDVAALHELDAGADADPGEVPEPLLAALFSYLLGVRLPGSGTNYLKQEIRFLTPAPIGRRLTARVEITRLRPEKHLCDLATELSDDSGRLVASGRALVLVKDVTGGGV